MSIGLSKHFNVKWAVDNDHMAAATLQANKTSTETQIYTEDAKTFLKKSVEGNPCYPVAGEPDHIHFSPPCKGFSRANRNGGKDDLRNNKQTLLFINGIKFFRPKTASYENVGGLVMDNYKGYLMSVVSSLLLLNYQVRVKVLTASNYGDPQNR
jgi:site-specific DNA-cytosine methylase